MFKNRDFAFFRHKITNFEHYFIRNGDFYRRILAEMKIKT
jgi:hypothetical protein